MISIEKVIEIFFIIDVFCKEFEQELSNQPVLASDGVQPCHLGLHPFYAGH